MDYDGYETTADLNEAIHYERLDADMLQAQYEAEGRAAAARRAQGICDHHGCALGHKSPPFYSESDVAAQLSVGHFKNREGYTKGQDDIGEGNMLCLECGAVVPDPCA